MNVQSYLTIQAELLEKNVTLVAISKTQSVDAIKAIYNQGQRVFGENKVQELIEKYESLPKDIEWHLVGHLQRNKVKYIAPFVKLIHSIDSLRLLEEVEKQAMRHERTIQVLLQIYIANEESKFGLESEELSEVISAYQAGQLSHIRIRGLMGMATNTDNNEQVKIEFASLKQKFDQLKDTVFHTQEDFDTISMGMSSDYQDAIACGSNMVRLGSILFGERHYI